MSLIQNNELKLVLQQLGHTLFQPLIGHDQHITRLQLTNLNRACQHALRKELTNLILPVVGQSGGTHDETLWSLLLKFLQGVDNLNGGEGLEGLAEPHLIAEGAVEGEIGQLDDPGNAVLLVLAVDDVGVGGEVLEDKVGV